MIADHHKQHRQGEIIVVQRSGQCLLPNDGSSGLPSLAAFTINFGAITGEGATATSLSLQEIQTRSFYRILEGRRKK